MIRDTNEMPALPILRIAAAIGIALVAIVAVPATVGLSLAQSADGGADGRDEAAIEQRRTQIQHEIATLKQHPWAGDYYEGDGLGANISITLAPETGIAATWHGCLGLYGANRGKVVERDGELRFEYEQPNKRGFGGFPDQVRPVRWGERRYMIPEKKMIAFVNAINRGFEPREGMHGLFLLADGDEKKSVVGMPDLPKSMGDLIRLAPLEVRIVSVDAVEKRKSKVGADCGFHYRMMLDRGTKDGLAPGVELKVIGQPDVSDIVTVRTVAGGTASADMGIWSVDCTRPKSVPAAGWRLSTGAYAGMPATAR
jgi:hypothetical protein